MAEEPRALALLPAGFRDPAERRAIAKRSAERRISPDLAAVLRAQDRPLFPSAARKENIEALARPGSVAVVSGQQVGLFLGPLYTIFKAASAIALARTLEKETGLRAIPVFWLQTEDHDFDEIDHSWVRDRSGQPLRISLSGEAGDRGHAAERCAIAYCRLGPGIEPALAALSGALGGLARAEEVEAIFARHYRPERTIAAAFAGVIAELFAGEGLVIFDPRDPAVAALTRPIYRRSIERIAAIGDALEKQSRALEEAGFTEQVHLRPDSPLFFFHPDGAEGPRHRLERTPAGWSILGTGQSVSEAELMSAIDQDPLRLSSSALLRPIVQDSLFPTAAYVGGPGEINYFAQLMPIYPLFEIAPPMIVPRARFRLIDPKIGSLLDKLGLEPKDAEGPRDELLRRLAARSAAPFPSAEEVRAGLSKGVEEEIGRLETRIPALDPTLVDPLLKTRETIAGAIRRFSEKYERALLERDRVTAERVDRIQRELFPNGVPQERCFSMAHFAATSGCKDLLARIFSALDPLKAEIVDLNL